MSSGEDWLQDPLIIRIDRGSDKRRKLKSPDDEQNDLWWSFHFATRLKLNGADHFCRQVLGAASMSYRKGLPLLAHRQLEWYLDAFFFELMSAYDTLLQELNIVYEIGFKLDEVRWNDKKPTKFMNALPEKITNYMDIERNKDWFKKVRKYRNMATHHYLVPISSWETGWGDEPLDYTTHEVHIHYLGEGADFKGEDVKMCKKYLNNMVKYIRSVWKEMAGEFQ